MVQRGRPQQSDFANGNGRNRRDPDTETGQNAGIFRGTEGSNPVSSSGESRANLISSIRALKFAKRDGVTPFSSLQQRVTCELELGRDACTRPHRRSRCQVGSEAEERRVKDSVLGLAQSIETGAEQPFPSREIASSGR